jgi:DNA-binding Lrp family transcriptional regulator
MRVSASRLHPFDIVVAIRLLRHASGAAGTLMSLADELAVVPSQVHAAIRRLLVSGLLKPETRESNPRALGEFLLFGVRYAFPAVRGPLAMGVPTAYSATPLAEEIDAVDVVVWPAPRSPQAVRGFSVAPLYRQAPQLVERSPDVYRLLVLVDAMRIGEAPVRNAARSHLERALGWRSAGAPAEPAARQG